MLRISRLTDYAILLLGHMAQNAGNTHAATDLAEASGVAVPTVSKILKALTKSQILKSTRGAKGGYALSRPPEQTSVAAVIHALEGPIALTECEGEHGGCRQSESCHARANWDVINRAIRSALESVTLADMARPVKVPDEIRVPVSSLYQSRKKVLSAE
jgi:FeS assembly SUF system regulator